MRPKSILWIAVCVLFSIWYVLDPAAHPIGDVFAKSVRVGIEQMLPAGRSTRADRQGSAQVR